MILRSLRAQGFMKYESLELADLPKGAIAIEGENEAGKTTIGECVAFALFGRTVRTEETDPAQAIHWDSDRAVVQVEFELSGQEVAGHNGNAIHRLPGVYKLERAVERGGAFEARLWAPNGQLLGGNPREVAKALPRVLGFSFPEFRYSFYVAQKELDLVRHATRDNTKRIIYDMLGITAVERARALVTRELEEARERTRTLDRDLVVARALLTEAQGDREAGEQALRDREQAEAEAGAAATAEEQARAARERAVASADARRDSLTALSHLEGAILAGAHRQRLVGARAQLASAALAAKAQADRATGILQKDESARADLKGRLEKARSAREAARALAAIVDARAARLKAELAQAEGRAQSSGSGHSLGERTARETERAQRLSRARSRRTALLVVLALAATSFGGMAAALRIEPAKKALVDAGLHPIDFKDPLYQKDVNLGAPEAFYGFALLGTISLIWTLFVAFGRRGFSAEAAASEADLERLMVGVEKLRTDLAACEGFDTKKLKEIDAKARKIEGDEAVSKALVSFNAAAKDVASQDSSPDALVDELQKKLDALDTARAKAEPTANEAGRILRTAQRALEAADGAIDERAKQIPAAPGEDMAALDLASLDKKVEEAATAAARARVELDALKAAGQDGTVPEGARALMDSLGKVFEGRPDAKGTFDKQSGLRALLDAIKKGSPAPTPENLRDALKREREVLKIALGTEDEARALVSTAEEGYRKAREVRARVDARLAEARARGERAQIGQTRGQELEVKVAGIESVLGPLANDVLVHEECLRLQEDLVKAMKARFGPEIGRYIEVVLPRLTAGRYRKTRLDEDLDLRVFSNERGDFVRLVDISFGTADQVLLALRLGLARALVASRGIPGEHFLFLDEPLASADESRGQAFLELLRSFDDEFAQVFVTSTRPLEGAFAKRIELATVTKNVKA